MSCQLCEGREVLDADTGKAITYRTLTLKWCPCKNDKDAIHRDAKRRILDTAIPPRFSDATLQNFQTFTRDARLLKNAAADFCDTWHRKSGKGLTLVGLRGTGKTRLACSILHELIFEKGATGFFINAKTLKDKIPQSSRKHDLDAEDDKTLERCFEADALVLDDIGAIVQLDWVVESLYGIVNDRYNACRSTIITGNYETVEQFERAIDGLVVSRLEETNGLPMVIKDQDMRKTVNDASFV